MYIKILVIVAIGLVCWMLFNFNSIRKNLNDNINNIKNSLSSYDDKIKQVEQKVDNINTTEKTRLGSSIEKKIIEANNRNIIGIINKYSENDKEYYVDLNSKDEAQRSISKKKEDYYLSEDTRSKTKNTTCNGNVCFIDLDNKKPAKINTTTSSSDKVSIKMEEIVEINDPDSVLTDEIIKVAKEFNIPKRTEFIIPEFKGFVAEEIPVFDTNVRIEYDESVNSIEENISIVEQEEIKKENELTSEDSEVKVEEVEDEEVEDEDVEDEEVEDEDVEEEVEDVEEEVEDVEEEVEDVADVVEDEVEEAENEITLSQFENYKMEDLRNLTKENNLPISIKNSDGKRKIFKKQELYNNLKKYLENNLSK